MNLLPVREKRIVRQEYHKRLAVVAQVFFVVLVCMMITSIGASYIVSTYEVISLEREIASISGKNTTQSVTASMALIKDTNNKLGILEQDYTKDRDDLSEIFSSIINSTDVRLTSFVYDQVVIKKGEVSGVDHRIVLGGIADDRESLTEFVRILRSDKRFKSVELPVSSLIENKDINFFITIILVKK